MIDLDRMIAICRSFVRVRVRVRVHVHILHPGLGHVSRRETKNEIGREIWV